MALIFAQINVSICMRTLWLWYWKFHSKENQLSYEEVLMQNEPFHDKWTFQCEMTCNNIAKNVNAFLPFT